jgi:hypothetical protein
LNQTVEPAMTISAKLMHYTRTLQSRQ